MKKEFKTIIETINKLVNIDITSKVSMCKRNFMIVNNLSDNEKINIERIGYQYKKYRIEKNGVSGTAIILN